LPTLSYLAKHMIAAHPSFLNVVKENADGEVAYYVGMLYFVKDKHTDPMSPRSC
jgi:hypothetical protein